MTKPNDEQPADESEPKFRSRDRFTKFDPKMIEDLIQALRKYYEYTDPQIGDRSCKGKDAAALATLMLARELVDEVAGWALDHAIGKAVAGQSWIGSYPATVKGYPEYLKLLEEADSHEHEQIGGRLYDDFSLAGLPPKVARQALLNLVRANSGAFPARLSISTVEALTALSFGEALPIFKPEKDVKRKVRYQELMAQLRAMEHIEFRVARGMRKDAAREEVATAYKTPAETLRFWEKQVRKGLGNLIVASRLADAKAQARRKGMGMSFVKASATIFGDNGLLEDADRYRKIARTRPGPNG